jgi:hypothetical protein
VNARRTFGRPDAGAPTVEVRVVGVEVTAAPVR